MGSELPEGSKVSLDAILEDNTSGSTTIIGASSRLLSEMEDMGALRRALLDILSVHGSMAGLVNFADKILRAMDEGSDIRKILEHEKEKRASDLSKLVGNTAQKVLSASRIVTISNSSTIIEVLTASHQRGAGKEVVISEARPAMEGKMAARKLALSGLKVTMVADGALPQEVHYSDLVLVGADSVTEKGVVNKIGTLGLISTARDMGIPTLSAFTTDKMIGSGYNPFRRALHPPEELMEPERGIEVLNYYFDQTPLEMFTTLMTEKGEMDRMELISFIDERDLHPDILSLLSAQPEGSRGL
ncbi:MAG: hypothetical protein U9R75_06845 [Candidatus Thermoplasmatota archaeon]|nr:hypothetical protein [Candidatus Thermoplasmatota archaeon]